MVNQTLKFEQSKQALTKIRESLSTYSPVRIIDEKVDQIINDVFNSGGETALLEVGGYLLSRILSACMYCLPDHLEGKPGCQKEDCPLHGIGPKVFEQLRPKMKESALNNWGKSV